MSSRRTTALATALAAVATGSVLLLPATSAHAADSALTYKISDVSQTVLHRGNTPATLTFAVTNPSDAPLPYQGSAALTASEGFLYQGSVTIGVTPLDAPATDSEPGDVNGADLAFYPKGELEKPFMVPAHSSYSWKITVSPAPDYPSNSSPEEEGSFWIYLYGQGASRQEQDNATHRFDVEPGLVDTFDTGAVVAPGKPAVTWLELDDYGSGSFPGALTTEISDYGAPSAVASALTLEVRSGGKWVALEHEGDQTQWLLPAIPAGFSHGQKHRYELRFSLKTEVPGVKEVGLGATTRYLGRMPFVTAAGRLQIDPASATATPTPTASASASASASAAPTTPGPTTPAANSPAPDGTSGGGEQLASTGAAGTGMLAGIAALLAAVGAGLTFGAARRRRASPHS
jgi:hypothetical protein